VRRVVVVGVVVAVLLGGAWVLGGGFRGGAGDVETVAVTRGPLESTIELAGTVAARESRTLAFGTGGTVAEVAVGEGSEVGAGDLLATLEAATQQAQLAAARSALASAEAAITSAQSRLDADRDADAPRAVRDADRAQLAAARAQAAAARSQLAGAEAALGLTELRAPIDGTVVALGLAPGDRIPAAAGAGGLGGTGADELAGTIVIADLSELRVATSASEIDIVDLRDDQPVSLSFDALPEATLAATICELATAGRETGGVVEFAVEVCLDETDARLRAGMSANVSIVLASVADALVVPSQAVRIADGAASVRVLDADGTIRTVPVEVGISSGTRTQIVAGLAEGDRVVVGDPATDPD
jgi:RND family efflux transporter MFP subunit